jgi:hypothetical protein
MGVKGLKGLKWVYDFGRSASAMMLWTSIQKFILDKSMLSISEG